MEELVDYKKHENNSMEFTGKQMVSDIELFTLKVERDEFFQDESIHGGTTFLVKKQTVDLQVLYVENSIEYVKQYGPYSVEVFSKKIRDIYASFADAEKMTSDQRLFVRKMWLFKHLFEMFDGSMNLILVRMTNLIPNIYGKAINILEKGEKMLADYDERTKKSVRIPIDAIRKVYNRVTEILTDVKFLKLLSPELLTHFVRHAPPYMVSKIRCLSWIEPEIAIIAEPNYNIYWSLFWHPFFKKNFRISSDLCFAIAEYMPIKLRGETFLDYFRRKYNANRGHFNGDDAFKIEKTTALRNGHFWNNITVVFRE